MKTPWQIARAAFPWLGLLCVVGLLAGGCQAPKKNFTFSPLPESDTSDVGSYNATNRFAAGDRFAVGDLITLQFSGTVDAIPPHAERIKEDGTITLPLIGVVRAAGKTPAELYREIHDLYVPRYYKQLTVSTSTFQRVYYVGGQVHSPGRQVYLGATTVTKAIESPGGFTEYAARWAVELVRPDGKKFKVNCRKASEEPSLDLPVYPGDKINVPLTTPPSLMQRLY